MRSERVTFPGSSGTPLAGRLDMPDDQPQAFALFAHCFTCSKDVRAASGIAQALTGFGIAVLRFDFTGLGGSDGDFANTNFTSNIADLSNPADYLRESHAPPSILIGHSLGGAGHSGSGAISRTISLTNPRLTGSSHSTARTTVHVFKSVPDEFQLAADGDFVG